jgi:membrane protease YdiL (CAAX protease family)
MTRFGLGTFVILLTDVGLQVVRKLTLDRLGLEDNIYLRFLTMVLIGVAVCIAYAGFVRAIEWRSPSELGLRGAAREFAAGAAGGFALMATAIGILFAVGAYQVNGRNSPEVLVPWLALGLHSGLFEETLFRCLWFRVVEEWLGTWPALVVSSLLFGFLHLFNDGATLRAAVAISLEAGLLLGAAFLLTRRLWFAAGVHSAWNFTQGGIFGAPVSGLKMEGWLASSLTGPDWLTGGEFGPEASVVVAILCTAAGVALLTYVARRGTWVAVFWRRGRPAALAVAAGQSDIATGVFPVRDGFGHPTPAENETERRPDRRAEDRTDVIDEL